VFNRHKQHREQLKGATAPLKGYLNFHDIKFPISNLERRKNAILSVLGDYGCIVEMLTFTL